MKKFTIEETKQAMSEAWRIKKSFDAEMLQECQKVALKKFIPAMFSECLKLAYNNITDNRLMTFNEWFNFYNNNLNSFMFMFWKNEILSKNGKETKEGDEEVYREIAEATSSNYDIHYSNEIIEDLQQETLCTMIKYIDKRGGTIPFGDRFKLYGFAIRNTFSMHKINEKKHNFKGDEREQLSYTKDFNSMSDLKLTLESLFPTEYIQLLQLRLAGYDVTETCKKLNISRPTYYSWKKKIADALITEGIYLQNILKEKSA